jgi:hypothetical protein
MRYVVRDTRTLVRNHTPRTRFLSLTTSSQSHWTSTSFPDLPRVEHTPSRRPTSAPFHEGTIQHEPAFEELVIIPGEPEVPTPPSPRRGSTTRLVVTGTSLAVLAVAAAAVFLTTRPRPAPIAAPPALPAAPAPVAPATVRLEIVASPADATLVLDGKPLATNPYVGAFARDTKVHELVVAAAGYRSLAQQFAADRDLALRLNLVPEPTREPPPAEPPHKSAVKQTTHHSAPSRARSAPKPEAATVEPPVAPKPEPVATKHGLDTDVYSKPTSKRALDSNVLDGSAAKPKPAIDRDNPWEK